MQTFAFNTFVIGMQNLFGQPFGYHFPLYPPSHPYWSSKLFITFYKEWRETFFVVAVMLGVTQSNNVANSFYTNNILMLILFGNGTMTTDVERYLTLYTIHFGYTHECICMFMCVLTYEGKTHTYHVYGNIINPP